MSSSRSKFCWAFQCAPCSEQGDSISVLQLLVICTDFTHEQVLNHNMLTSCFSIASFNNRLYATSTSIPFWPTISPQPHHLDSTYYHTLGAPTMFPVRNVSLTALSKIHCVRCFCRAQLSQLFLTISFLFFCDANKQWGESFSSVSPEITSSAEQSEGFDNV